MKIDILTLFPEMFTAVTESSMLGRATYNGILEVKLTDIRKYTDGFCGTTQKGRYLRRQIGRA